MAVPRLRCGIARRRRQLTRREGEVVREEAVRIAAPQGPADVSVDVSGADWRTCGSCVELGKINLNRLLTFLARWYNSNRHETSPS
jgi:hypothetical protein